jgi:hypothetical protein
MQIIAISKILRAMQTAVDIKLDSYSIISSIHSTSLVSSEAIFAI